MAAIQLEWSTPHSARVTINRPERRNALRREDITALTAALDVAAQHSELRGVILTGNGAFSSGADLQGLSDAVRERDVTTALYEPVHALIRMLLSVPVPTIAALDGPALGMGTDIALACDCRLIGPDGWLRQGWAAHGVIPAAGGIRFLRHLSPVAIWKMLDGQPSIDGPWAERLGIGEAVTDGTAVDAAERRVAAYASIPPDALRAYVELARRDVRLGLDDELAECARVQASLFNRDSFATSINRTLNAQETDPR